MDGPGFIILLVVFVPLVLFLIRVLVMCKRNRALARQLKREETNGCQRTAPNIVSAETGNRAVQLPEQQPPKDDLPPSYDDVIQHYIDVKSAYQTSEECRAAVEAANASEAAAAAAQMVNAESTTTIETVVEVNASATDLHGPTHTIEQENITTNINENTSTSTS